MKLEARILAAVCTLAAGFAIGTQAAELSTSPSFVPVNLAVCRAIAQVQHKTGWIPYATYSLQVPHCPRPIWINLCYYRINR